MKSSFLIISLIILTSCNQDISNRKYRNENYVFYQEDGKEGEWLKINPTLENKLPKSLSTYFFPNGNIYAELKVIDSFPNRIVKHFDTNKKHTYTNTYTLDSLVSQVFENGYYYGYHSNLGLLQSEGMIKNNMYHGKWKFYREDGNILKQIVEYVKDTLHGIRKDYWENGKLKSSTTNLKGLQNGQTYHYYDNGEVQEINFLKDNKVHGKSIRYYRSGKLESKCNYWLGKIKDTCKFYYENGNLLKHSIVDLDTVSLKSTGITYRYYESGELEKILPTKNGKVNGIVKLYYKNGNLAQEINIIKGVNNGIAHVYYETGELHYTGLLKNNLFDGAVIYYDKKGKLTKTVNGKNGVAIDSIMH